MRTFSRALAALRTLEFELVVVEPTAMVARRFLARRGDSALLSVPDVVERRTLEQPAPPLHASAEGEGRSTTMASATRTRDHDEIRRWVEDRGGIPTIVEGTEGLLRIDFVRGAKSGGREASLEEVDWDRWFELFDDNELTFLYTPDGESKFFKLVSASRRELQEQPRQEPREERGGGEWNVVLVTHEDDGWCVELEGDGHQKTYSTKADAVHHARELARRHQPAELVIEKVDGEEQDRIHYGDPQEHARH